MPTPRVCALGALLSIAVGVSPSAAAAPALTLPEALKLAERNSEIPRIAAQRVAQARAARREAYAGLLPTLALSGGYRHGTRSILSTGAGVSTTAQGRDTLTGTGRLDLALVDPTAFPRIAAAARSLDAEQHAERHARHTLYLDTAEAFFAVLAAEQVASAAQQRVQVATIGTTAAERRLQAGLAGRNDLTRAQLELEAARLAALQADNGLAQARLALGFLIGADVPAQLMAPEGPIVTQLPEQALTSTALDAREDLRALRKRTQAADALRDEPWLGLVPRLDASAIGSISDTLGGNTQSRDWTLALTATWIAYDGGARYAQAAARAAAMQELQLEVDTLGRQVRFEIRTALADLATASSAVDVAQARREAAERNLDEVRARFDSGLADALAMADATEQAYLAATEVAGQRLSLRLAELALLRATGQPLPSLAGSATR